MKRHHYLVVLAVASVLGTPSWSAAQQPVRVVGDTSPAAVSLQAAIDAIAAATAATQAATEATQAVLANLAPECNATAPIEITASGNNEIVPLVSGMGITGCNVTWVADGAVSVQWVYGTGTDCGTGETILTGIMPFGVAGTAPPGLSGRGLHVPAGQALCAELSGAVGVHGWLEYTYITP